MRVLVGGAVIEGMCHLRSRCAGHVCVGDVGGAVAPLECITATWLTGTRVSCERRRSAGQGVLTQLRHRGGSYTYIT